MKPTQTTRMIRRFSSMQILSQRFRSSRVRSQVTQWRRLTSRSQAMMLRKRPRPYLRNSKSFTRTWERAWFLTKRAFWAKPRTKLHQGCPCLLRNKRWWPSSTHRKLRSSLPEARKSMATSHMLLAVKAQSSQSRRINAFLWWLMWTKIMETLKKPLDRPHRELSWPQDNLAESVSLSKVNFWRKDYSTERGLL